MLLVIDVGNTNLTLGIYEGARLLKTWRLPTNKQTTADELGLKLKGLVASPLSGICISSVVPPLDEILREACQGYLKQNPLFVTSSTRLGIKNRYKRPEEVGADRLVNAVAIHALYRKAAIGVDFGTATTFDCVSAKGDYLGGVIAPGLEIAMDVLAERTSKLPKVTFQIPSTVMGKTTKQSLQSGLYWGYIALVEGLLTRLKSELKMKPLIIATGGLSTVIGPHLKGGCHIEPDLTLHGLRLIWELNNKR